MKNLSSLKGCAALARLVCLGCAGLGLALGPGGKVVAQAPVWDVVASGAVLPGVGGGATATAVAVGAGGGVYVTGYFTGTTTFGTTRLVSAGGWDVFVAKWDATARGYTWAARGGGTGNDMGIGVAVSNASVYVTGYFESGTNSSIAGQTLAGAGGPDVFVARYADTSTGHTPATSSFANGWATSAGGTGFDYGQGIAVSGAGVFVTGGFFSNRNARIAGQALAGAGNADVFVAKYVDTSTGSTPATSSFADAWATSAGGTSGDQGQGLAISGTSVYVVGDAVLPATFGPLALGPNASGDFLARLPTTFVSSTRPGTGPSVLTLSPNPATAALTVGGAPAGAAVAVFDALGRPVATALADATGTARLRLPAGLAAGVYVVRAGTQSARLAVE